MLDTGASATLILNERLGRKLQLHPRRTITLAGAGSDACKAESTPASHLSVSGKELPPVEIDWIDLSNIEGFVGRSIDGIIGGELFRSYPVALDFTTSRAVVLMKNELDYAGLTGIPLLATSGLCCTVELDFLIAGKPLHGRFVVDTGAPSIEVALAARFARQHNLSPAQTKAVALPTLCAMSYLLPHDETVDVQMGDVLMRDVHVDVSIDQAGAFANGAFDGIIGGAFLRRLDRVVIDVPHMRLLVNLRAKEAQRHKR